jgi:uncharacterized membrane protein YccF (DUF307 family)
MSEFDEKSFQKKMKTLETIALLLLILGVALQSNAFRLEFTEFTPILEELIPIQKPLVDEADPGSRLAMLKTEAAKFPPKLMTFKLVGIGSILTGIWILLFGIIQALKEMPVRAKMFLTQIKMKGAG